MSNAVGVNDIPEDTAESLQVIESEVESIIEDATEDELETTEVALDMLAQQTRKKRDIDVDQFYNR